MQDSQQFGLAHSAARDIRFQFQNLKYNEYNMTIGTKYNIGDEVWFMFDSKPLNGKIARISEYTIKIKVIFKDGKEYFFSRDIKGFKLFPTKEELLKSL